MNTENEKKWFVYIGDHHEGPLSVREVFDKKQQGQVTLESYVWREGMADWLMLHQVPELETEITALAPAKSVEAAPGVAAATAPTAAEPVAIEPEVSAEVSPEPAPAPKAVEKTASMMETVSPKVQESVSIKKEKQKSSTGAGGVVKGLIIAVGALAIVAIVGLIGVSRTSNASLHARVRPMLESVVSKAPFLKSAIKLVPRLADVKPGELADLDSGRSASLESGARIGVGLSNSDPNRPAFYLTSNLSHGTQLTLLLIGEPDTLLNRLQVTVQMNATLSHGFTKSEVFLLEGGQPLPKGDYRVYVFDSSEQQDEAAKAELGSLNPNRGTEKLPAEVPQSAKVVIAKKFFLGGERDQTYLTRLKAFHENIRQKADRELSELHQYAETLILQHNSLTGEFQKMYKAKKLTASMKNSWKKDSAAWLQISGQLDQTIQTWSKETLQNEFFYGKAYELVKNAFQSMRTLFQLEIDFFEKNLDRNAFEIQHGKLLSEARDSLDLMRAKTEILFKAPKTQSGLPSREGL
jgi:hypothetical protein